jgi:hypothetical protein
MLKLVFIMLIIILFSSCEHIANEGDANSLKKYPTQVGREWEYHTEWKIEFYDTAGHIDSTSNELSENTIVKIIKENDTVGSYNNLILFESYDLSSPQILHRLWYMNVDSGLFAVAYSNPGASQPVLPKQTISSYERLKTAIKLIGAFPGSCEGDYPPNYLVDTIRYYTPLRKVLMYPLTIGARWTELIEPFYRERIINRQQIISINDRNYNCYKVESSWNLSPSFKFIDYIDLNSGLVMRELIADSITISSSTTPDTIGFYKSTTISKLVREQAIINY